MSKLLVIVGHPDLDSLTSAFASAYAEAARGSGAHVTRLDLAALCFDPWLRRAYKGEQPLEPDLLVARQAILEAQHIAWFFPMWWGGPPALVKAFIERVFTPGFAFRYRGRNQLPSTLLAGRSARLVTTMDSPAAWYTFVLRRPLHASFGMATLSFVGFSPIQHTTFYETRFRSDGERAKAFAQVRRAAHTDVRALLRRSPRQVVQAQLASSPPSAG
jgi:putative NADPH-quinone reductase